MNKILHSLAVVSLVPVFANAGELNQPQFYGKANLSWQYVSENDENYTELVSNASRLGVKGSVSLDSGLTGIYQVEVEVDKDGDSDDLFKQRNTYVGVEGGFGEFIAGYFDTPLKQAQKKVDLFNDLEGDIKSMITRSDNRGENSVQYTSPSFSGFKAKVNVLNSEEENIENGVSSSLSFEQENLYVAVAYDSNVEGENINVIRVVGQFTFGPVQLGALFERDEENDNSEDGSLVSVMFKASDKTYIKVQAGESDILHQGAVTSNVGVDYKLSKKSKVFAYLTHEEYENGDADIENDYAGVGLEIKF